MTDDGYNTELVYVPDASADWVKITSWHVWSGLTSRGGMVKTLCGKWTLNRPRPDYPASEKTCELCLRSKARKEEKAK